ncbi:hypothetical protein D9611_007499 [Ephemerocybe angulata]|uniref:Nephrocystin 3-like N-terminal domain-containing protein n=1 Tax=Ephemerocybe angulata TaxID=980116 RepID=A0A8H5CFC6_9AGAR|nr:hypothetical protein D9611_007499 [Tulosesus angulatus]
MDNTVAPRGHLDSTQNFFTGASNVSARDISIVNAGRDIINIHSAAPMSGAGAEATVDEVLAWLKGANFRAIHRLSLEARMEKTGTWLVATFEFGEFVRKKGTVVWATGLLPRQHYSAISIEHLEDIFYGQNIAIVYAFLRYSEKLTLHDIIAGMLSQLVRSDTTAFTHILPTYQRSKKFGDVLSCSEAVKALKGILGLFSDAFIVIDGLDEVDDGTKDGLLRVVTSLQAHVLITCRPLDLFKRRHTPHALHIPIQAQTGDIEIYVTERIKESTVLANILSENPTIAARFSTLVKEKSQGMFLLARLQVELVLERCTTVGSLLKALDALPSGVADMYRATMERISAQSEEAVSVAHRTFIWLLHACDGLTIKALQHALAFSYNDLVFDEDNVVSLSTLLLICCGLVTVEKEAGEDVVRFIR